MKKDLINIIELSKLIVERLKYMEPEKIILFGSYAYGEPDTGSDIDICIVRKQESSKLKLKREIRKKLQDIIIAKDILVPSKEEYDFYKTQSGSVFKDIENRGKVLMEQFLT